MRRAAALTTLVLALAPAATRAQFAPLPPAQGQTQTTVVVPQNDSGNGGLKSWQQFLIFGAGGILLVGIGWAIVSDARNRAPVREGETHRLGGRGSPRRSEREKQRARARAKAARAQRKRQR